MDKELRAAIKAMGNHQLCMSEALSLILESKGIDHTDYGDELRTHATELEDLMGNLTYD